MPRWGLSGNMCHSCFARRVPFGKREKEGDVRGEMIPGDDWARLHALAEKLGRNLGQAFTHSYGEAVRLGKGRETGDT